jgi:hypothetical protein
MKDIVKEINAVIRFASYFTQLYFLNCIDYLRFDVMKILAMF